MYGWQMFSRKKGLLGKLIQHLGGLLQNLSCWRKKFDAVISGLNVAPGIEAENCPERLPMNEGMKERNCFFCGR